jgi:hypothetical protein
MASELDLSNRANESLRDATDTFCLASVCDVRSLVVYSVLGLDVGLGVFGILGVPGFMFMSGMLKLLDLFRVNRAGDCQQ